MQSTVTPYSDLITKIKHVEIDDVFLTPPNLLELFAYDDDMLAGEDSYNEAGSTLAYMLLHMTSLRSLTIIEHYGFRKMNSAMEEWQTELSKMFIEHNSRCVELPMVRVVKFLDYLRSMEAIDPKKIVHAHEHRHGKYIA